MRCALPTLPSDLYGRHGRRGPSPATSLPSHDAARTECCDVVFGERQNLGEQLVRVLARERRRRRRRWGFRQVDGTPGQAETAAGRVIDRMDLAARVQVRIVEDLAGVERGAARHPGLAERGHPVLL